MVKLRVNGVDHQLAIDPATPLLWALRDSLGLVGTKFGCGVSLCGACSVQVDGKAIRSCVTPVSTVEGKAVTTIEGLPADHPVIAAWIANEVPQCGYCQVGQIMVASALLAENPHPTDDDIDRVMTNICRCGTYQRIRAAVHAASGDAKGGK